MISPCWMLWRARPVHRRRWSVPRYSPVAFPFLSHCWTSLEELTTLSTLGRLAYLLIKIEFRYTLCDDFWVYDGPWCCRFLKICFYSIGAETVAELVWNFRWSWSIAIWKKNVNVKSGVKEIKEILFQEYVPLMPEGYWFTDIIGISTKIY